MANTKHTVDVGSKAKIFISYSRKDAAFADRLEEALKARDFHPLIDRSEIYAFEDWWKRIQKLIVQADTIISILSPDYVSSDTCKKEVEFAASRNKRFAPIEYRPVDCKLIPNALRRLNFEFFSADEQFEQTMDRLAEALQTDIDWIRKDTEFGAQAHQWMTDGRPRGLLLRSPILEEAEHWIASRPRAAPVPTADVRAFIAESRRATLRQRNFLTASLTAGLVLALGLAGLFYWQWRTTENARALTNQAFDTTEEIANKLVVKLGKDARLLNLSPYLREEIFVQTILGYDRVIMLNPMDAKIYRARGNAFLEKGKLEMDAADYGPLDSAAAAYDQAIADYSRAITRDRKDADAYSDRCWAGVIVAKQLLQALSDCNNALRIKPQNPKALDMRGYAYLKLGQVDDAIQSFNAALKIDPKLPTALYGRGLAKIMNQDVVGAAVDISKATAIRTNVADDLAPVGIKLAAQDIQSPSS
jgi:tetratricopeptide (TPR) repeat protein